MINMGTQVFNRLIEETKQEAAKAAKLACVRALADTMSQETDRFRTFSPEYVVACAEDRLDFYMNFPDKANCGNQVIPRA